MNYSKRGIRKRQLDLNARGPKWSRKFILLFIEAILVCVVGGGILCCALGIGVFKGILASAPDISTLTVAPSGRSSFIYDNRGNQIYKLVSANANRIPVGYDKVSADMEHAFVAIEDERFYVHNGIDIRGIFRAGFSVLQKGGLGQGASTITQQLLKNNVFTDWMGENSNIERVKRKIQEQYCAIQLEKIMSKEDILTNYLNTINLGQNTLGIQAASLRYFGKECDKLTLSECAVIAGITQNPSKYNPITHPEENAEKRETVLTYMLKQGYIDEARFKEAMADDVYSRIKTVNEVQGESQTSSYFVDAVIDQVTEDLKAAGFSDNQVFSLMYSGGIKIHSTMDPEIQKICDEEFANPDNYPERIKWLLKYKLTVQKADGTLDNHSSEMFKSYFKQKNSNFNMLYSSEEDALEAIDEYVAAVLEPGDEVFADSIEIIPQPQVSFSIEEQSTGKIVAMIGGRGKKERSRTFNRATQSSRQPGSCFKILASFGPALDAGGLSLATTFNDAPFNYYNGTPVSNWYGKDTYYGLCSLRYGVYWSLNVVAVKTITQITPELGFSYLKNMGFTTLEEARRVGDLIYTDIGQPLALGGITNGIINTEINAAYAGIANGGMYVQPKLYTKIEDADGNVIIDNTEIKAHRIFKDTTSWLLTDAMKDCVTIGTGTRARFPGMSIAGKTGTTSDSKDLWFVGYTPYYTAACWSGYDNNVEMNDNESRIPQTMFKAVMQRVHEDLPDIGFPKPEGIVSVAICSKSGKLPIPGLCDEHVKSEYFDIENVPTESCNVHFVGSICAFDNLPATDQCPFKYEGVAELAPIEHENLWQGSQNITNDLDPLAVGPVINTTGFCHHTAAFFEQPNWEDILAGERWQLEQRGGAAISNPVIDGPIDEPGDQPADQPADQPQDNPTDGAIISPVSIMGKWRFSHSGFKKFQVNPKH